MLRKKSKFAWASALALILVGLVLTAAAAQVSPPNQDKPARQEIAVDPKILDGYVGLYQFVSNKVFTVTRDGGQLSAQLTGQPAVPLYAESNTEFFYKVIDAQITFHPAARGVADSLVLHQNGSDFPMPRIDQAASQQLAARAAARFAAQTPQPGSEAALRLVVEGILSGHPSYEGMTDTIASAVKRQMPLLLKMADQGTITAIRFVGVNDDGSDAYSVMQQKGATHWQVSLDEKGVTNLWVVPGP